MYRNHRIKAFTLVELMTVLVVITILIGALLPAFSKVRKMAKTARQKAQFVSIEQALMSFKADRGDYPPSSQDDIDGRPYNGAQKLAEALVGQDMFGFHPDSVFRSDGLNYNDTIQLYPDDLSAVLPSDRENIESRTMYLESTKANAYLLGDIFQDAAGNPRVNSLDEDTPVLCDSFIVKRGRKELRQKPGTFVDYAAGTPILYWRANPSSKTMDPSVEYYLRRYNVDDNKDIMDLQIKLDQDQHPMVQDPEKYFYDVIKNPDMDSMVGGWPYNPDSFILISAGPDGLYGTGDDITNLPR